MKDNAARLSLAALRLIRYVSPESLRLSAMCCGRAVHCPQATLRLFQITFVASIATLGCFLIGSPTQPLPTSIVVVAMKKRWLSLTVLASLLALLGYAMSDKIFFVTRMAQLYTAEPDQQLAVPVAGVAKSQVNDSWHAPRDGGDRRHEGQDIFAPRGTPVLSATDGYVVRVGENKLGGRTVSVMGAGGRIYYYAHLDAYAPEISFGDYVTPQTVLGFVGTTGNAAGTAPHLHFGVYARGGAINPLAMLTDRPANWPSRTEPPKRKGRR